MQFESDNVADMVKAVLGEAFSDEGGATAYALPGGDWKVWDGERWGLVEAEAMADMVWLKLAESTCTKTVKVQKQDVTVDVPLKPTKAVLNDVLRGMEAVRRTAAYPLPRWIGEGEGLENPQYLVSLRDGLVDLRKSADAGQLVIEEKTKDWFDDLCLPVSVEELMQPCPFYEEKMGEWGSGCPVWTETAERAFGSALMTWRGFARGVLQEGKARGGKGTKTRFMRRLMGGGPYWGARMEQAVGSFGLDGLQYARMAVVSEVGSMKRGDGAEFAGILKGALGEDDISINVKHRRQIQNVRVGAMWFLQGNEIPEMPDTGGGVLNKLVILPYQNSWVGKEDTRIDEKLWAEKAGVVRRMLEASARMVAREGGDPFPRIPAAMEVRARYEERNNPADAFLQWGFVKAENGFVAGELLDQKLVEWNDGGGRLWIPRNRLLATLERESSWNLRRWRLAQGGDRGLRGLMMR